MSRVLHAVRVVMVSVEDWVIDPATDGSGQRPSLAESRKESIHEIHFIECNSLNYKFLDLENLFKYLFTYV